MKITSKILDKIKATNMVTEEDIKWFKMAQEEPDKYDILLDWDELNVAYVWNQEDFDYTFSIHGRHLIQFLLKVLEIDFKIV